MNWKFTISRATALILAVILCLGSVQFSMAQQEVRIGGRNNRDFDCSNSGMSLISIVKNYHRPSNFWLTTLSSCLTMNNITNNYDTNNRKSVTVPISMKDCHGTRTARYDGRKHGPFDSYRILYYLRVKAELLPGEELVGKCLS
jgi:hypothetical protein